MIYSQNIQPIAFFYIWRSTYTHIHLTNVYKHINILHTQIYISMCTNIYKLINIYIHTLHYIYICVLVWKPFALLSPLTTSMRRLQFRWNVAGRLQNSEEMFSTVCRHRQGSGKCKHRYGKISDSLYLERFPTQFPSHKNFKSSYKYSAI